MCVAEQLVTNLQVLQRLRLQLYIYIYIVVKTTNFSENEVLNIANVELKSS